MKVYDAVVTAKVRVSNVCTQEDLVGGLTFTQLMKDLIESDGLLGLADEVEIVHIESKERDE